MILLVRFRVVDLGKALRSRQDLGRCGWGTVFLADCADAYLVRKASGTRMTLVRKRCAYLRAKLKPQQRFCLTLKARKSWRCIGRGRMQQHRAGGRETAIPAIAIDCGELNDRDVQLQEMTEAPIWVSKCDRDRWIGAAIVPH